MSTVQPSPDLLFSHHMSEARGLRRAIRNRRQFVDYFEAKGMQQHAQAARHDVLKLRASSLTSYPRPVMCWPPPKPPEGRLS